jgi:flagella basal body P-ring formation protein FlgA
MTIAIFAAFAAMLGTPPCFAAARDIAAGTVLGAADVIAVECQAGKGAAIRYDRASGAVIASVALPVGAYLGRIVPLPEGQVAKGTVLMLRSAAGPVVVERQVTAMQSGRSGGQVFVRDGSGQIFAAPLQVEQAR